MRVNSVLERLGPEFEMVPLDVFLTMAGQRPAFQERLPDKTNAQLTTSESEEEEGAGGRRQEAEIRSHVNLEFHRHTIALGKVLLSPHLRLHGKDIRRRFAIRKEGRFPRRGADAHGHRYRSPSAAPSAGRCPDLLRPGRGQGDKMPSSRSLVEPQSGPYVHP